MGHGSRKRKAAGRRAPSQPCGEGPAPGRPKQRRPQAQPQPPSCRVEGCREPLKPGYHQKYRICLTHGSAPELVIDGRTVRWCQQCGRFHALQVFWGTQRSCRDSLLRHQERRLRRLGQLTAAAGQLQMQVQPAPPPTAGQPHVQPALNPAAGQPHVQPALIPAAGQPHVQPALIPAAGQPPRPEPPVSAAPLASQQRAAAVPAPLALSSPRRAGAVPAPAAAAPPSPQQQQQPPQECATLPQSPERPAKRSRQQQAAPEQPLERGRQQASPVRPDSSSSCRLACTAVGMSPPRTAQQPSLPPEASPRSAASLAAQAWAALAAQPAEEWDPVGPLTPAGRPGYPPGTARPLAAATPMHSSPGQALLPHTPWAVVRLAAAAPAAAAPSDPLAQQCSWPLPAAPSPQPWQPMPPQRAAQPPPSRPPAQLQQAWPCAVLVQQLPQPRGCWPPLQQAEQQLWEQLQPLRRASWPELPWEAQQAQHRAAQRAQQREAQHAQLLPRHAELLPQHSQAPRAQYCSSCDGSDNSGRASNGCGGRGGSPCLPHFNTHEIQALVEVLNPPSLDPPSPNLLEEALAWAGGAVSRCAADSRPGADAAPCGAVTACACAWGVPRSQPLCNWPACGSPAVRLPALHAPAPLLISPPDSAGGATAGQQLWDAAVGEGEQKTALAFAAMQLQQQAAVVPAAPQPAVAHPRQPPPACDWHGELLAASPLLCPPSPAFSWM